MNHKLKRVMSLVLAFLMVVLLIPVTAPAASAAEQTDIPQNMWNNSALRSLEYLGYNLDQQKADGTLYVLYGNDTIKYMPDPNIKYPEDGITCVNGTYQDWVGVGKTGGYKYTSKTGLAPIVSQFVDGNWVCASYFGYYVWNYLPNIEGVTIGHLTDYRSLSGVNSSYNISSVRYWYETLNYASKDSQTAWSGVSRVYTAAFDDLDAIPTDAQLSTFRPGDLIITGGIWEEGTEKAGENRYSHCAVYAGYYGGRHWVIQQSDACSAGPHIYPFDEFMTPTTWKSTSHIVGVYRLNFNTNPDTPFYEEGAIEIYKTDSKTGSALTGAQFLVVNNETGEYQNIGPTDANGYAKTKTELPFGTYTVTETVFPDGYKAVDGISSWTVEVNETKPAVITLNIKNEPDVGTARIIKKTTNGGTLDGWTFEIKDSAGNVVATPTTSGGTGIIDVQLQPGTYKIRETNGNMPYWTLDTAEKTITVEAGQTSSVTFTNQYFGKGKIVKTTTNGGTVAGWKFTVKDSSGATVGTYTTPASGEIDLDLNPGTYTVTELAPDSGGEYWIMDSSNPKTLTVTAGATATVTFHNQYVGIGKVVKKTTNNGSRSGWTFEIKNSSGEVVARKTTTTTGEFTVILQPGNYTITETTQAPNGYWKLDSTLTKEFTVTAGKTTTITYTNQYFGKGQVQKISTNGGKVQGWQFNVYTSAGSHVGLFTTNAQGMFEMTLDPGNYIVREVNINDPYWKQDLSDKYITITAGRTAQISVTNKWIGKAQIAKTTTNGGTLYGWEFTVRNAADNSLVGTYTTTPENGGNIVLDLDPGTYTVTENNGDADYWEKDPQPTKTVTVKAGETAQVNFINRYKGIIQVVKKATNGGKVANWEFTITDASGNVIATVTTPANGIFTLNVDPGKYFIQETASRDPYWHSDTTKYPITVKAGETSSITVTNDWIGKVELEKILKNPEAGTTSGWKFNLYKGSGNSKTFLATLTTGSNGKITYDLNPGVYTVEEVLDANSLWQCVSPQSQVVNITAGVTTQVAFENALRPGKIEITKTNTTGATLAGAKFLLEYSTDGKNWVAVSTTNATYPAVGGTTTNAPGGILTTGADGKAVWNGLYPNLYYRVTEIAAPNGYIKLSEPAFTGTLPAETLTVTLNVVNSCGYELPRTGGGGTGATTYGGTLVCFLALTTMLTVALIPTKKKLTDDGQKNN